MKPETILQPNEKILFTSKGTLDKMLPVIAGAVYQGGKFVATGIPSKGSKPKTDIGLLEVFLCLTNQRLTIWKTTWNGKPKEVWLSLPLEEVEKVDLKMVKFFWLLPNVKLRLKGGKKLGFSSAKIHAKRTLSLVDGLKNQLKLAS